MGTSTHDRARSRVQSLAHAAQLRYANDGSTEIVVSGDRRLWKPNMPRTARDISENFKRGFIPRSFHRAGPQAARRAGEMFAETYMKHVVLVLVIGQLALAVACTQSSGVRYISTQEPAPGSEREFVIHTGNNSVGNLETELPQNSRSYRKATHRFPSRSELNPVSVPTRVRKSQ